jgi:hypothetical protein
MIHHNGQQKSEKSKILYYENLEGSGLKQKRVKLLEQTLFRPNTMY